MITLLHGQDDLLRTERLAALRAALGPAELADLSTTWLDGRKTSLAEIRNCCATLPFLTPRRLVIVEGLLAQFSKRVQRGQPGRRQGKDGPKEDRQRAASISAAQEGQTELLAYLPTLPETTNLALVEVDVLGKRDPVHKLILELAQAGRAEVALCEPPIDRELPAWVAQRVQQKGAQIEGAAARDLAAFVGRNLRLLDSELDKLITYRSGEGPIRRQDVHLLTPYTQEANIFDMVDAIGRRDAATALRLLRKLERDGAAPLYLLAMIVRQFRILIQVSEQVGQGLNKGVIARNIGLHPYPTQKAMQQSQRWSLVDLEAVYDRLLEADLAVKTGKLPDDLALDLLVAELSQR